MLWQPAHRCRLSGFQHGHAMIDHCDSSSIVLDVDFNERQRVGIDCAPEAQRILAPRFSVGKLV